MPPHYHHVHVVADTFRMLVDQGKTYLLRIINAGMNEELFFSVAGHQLTVVGTDGSYIKPITTNYIMITLDKPWIAC